MLPFAVDAGGPVLLIGASGLDHAARRFAGVDGGPDIFRAWSRFAAEGDGLTYPRADSWLQDGQGKIRGQVFFDLGEDRHPLSADPRPSVEVEIYHIDDSEVADPPARVEWIEPAILVEVLFRRYMASLLPLWLEPATPEDVVDALRLASRSDPLARRYLARMTGSDRWLSWAIAARVSREVAPR